MPSRATFYRLMSYMDRGRRNFVSEASRRVSVNRPGRPFTPMMALRPGENVVIDTNKLDVMCRYADGVIRRAELTVAVDVATRSIPAGIIAPTTKAVDAAAVLARMLVPEPMRPAWPESLHHAHSVIPHERLLNIDERFANAAAKPVIIPETVNCDRGRDLPAGLHVAGHLGAAVAPLHRQRRRHRRADVRVDEHPVLPARRGVCRPGHHPARSGYRAGGHLDGLSAAGAVR
jgi:hypothetical protein